MSAHFGDAAFIQHDDAIGILDGGQPMGNDQRGASLHQCGQLMLHTALRLIVERGRGLIEHQYR